MNICTYDCLKELNHQLFLTKQYKKPLTFHTGEDKLFLPSLAIARVAVSVARDVV